MSEVVIIGGGATGVAVLRDLALRGIPAVLVERDDLASGASGRNHGLLHSGGRYAVIDPVAAAECAQENAILRRIAPWAVEPCGGLFVEVGADDPGYVPEWVLACRKAGIEAEEISPQAALEQEPRLNPGVVRAFRVPDAAVDSFRLVYGTAAAAQSLGARVYTKTEVTGLVVEGNRVTGVRLADIPTGEQWILDAELVINAAGAWAGRVAAMAGISLPVVPDRGTLVVYNSRLANRVINRLRLPGDGDIVVPVGTVTIAGTTAVSIDDPDDTRVPPAEVEQVVALVAQMLPELKDRRRLRSFTGVRPLFDPGEAVDAGTDRAGSAAGVSSLATRQLSRNYAVIDHARRDGVAGLVSLLGGKLTTHRLMAEKAANLAVARLGVRAGCRTATEPIPAPPPVREERTTAGGGAIVCECERVPAEDVLQVAQGLARIDLGVLRRRARVGMGTCQGAFCGYRTVGILHSRGLVEGLQAETLLCDFLRERLRGMGPAPDGYQLRQAELARAIYTGNLNLDLGTGKGGS